MRASEFSFRVNSKRIVKNLILIFQIGRAAWEACSINLESWNHLSICLNTEENQGKPVSRWPFAGPFGCVLTSSQQSNRRGRERGDSQTSPYHVHCCFIYKLNYTLHNFFIRIPNLGSLSLQSSAHHACCEVGPTVEMDWILRRTLWLAVWNEKHLKDET